MRMDHLRHEKYKNKRSENTFKLINISINGMAFEFNLLQWLQAITGVDRDAKVFSSAS